MQELRAIVSGRVQGVMMRDFVERRARGLGLVGYVQNLSDGTVEVVAQGAHEKLEALLVDLHRGAAVFAGRYHRLEMGESWTYI